MNSTVTASNTSQLNDVDVKKVDFVPDFTATIRDDCTYLEISAQTYLLAYKSTLINKKQRQDGAPDKDGIMSDFEDGNLKNEIPLNKITSEGFLGKK